MKEKKNRPQKKHFFILCFNTHEIDFTWKWVSFLPVAIFSTSKLNPEDLKQSELYCFMRLKKNAGYYILLIGSEMKK